VFADTFAVFVNSSANPRKLFFTDFWHCIRLKHKHRFELKSDDKLSEKSSLYAKKTSTLIYKNLS
jgi:hypothetical protein